MIESEEQFIAVSNKIYSAGYDDDFAYNCVTGSIHTISKQTSMQLQSLYIFQSLEEHAATLQMHGWPRESTPMIINGLQQLLDAGLIITRDELFQNIRNNPKNDTLNQITSIAWPTADRPDELKRSINSFIANNRQFDRNVDYRVFDDSDSTSSLQSNREILASIAKENGLNIYYAGPEEKKEFISKLCESSGTEAIPPSILDFALFNPFNYQRSSGANRNSLLLGSVETMVLSTDDDEFCSITQHPEMQNDITVSNKYDPTDLYFYKDHDTILNHIEYTDVDILHCHEELLGKSISECFSLIEKDDDINYQNISPGLSALISNKQASISATMAGYCGDSGMGASRVILALHGKSREAVMNSHDDYLMAANSRQITRIARSRTISNSPLFMAGNIGLDNRNLLPPFFPVMTNADGIFGTVLQKSLPQSLIGHIPYALLHEPPGERSYAEQSIISFSPRISEIINLLVNLFQIKNQHSDITENIHNLGLHLKEIGNLSKSDFSELLKIEYLKQIGNYIHFLEENLQRHKRIPDFWADDVEAHLENIQQYITGPDFLLPSDLLSEMDPEQALLRCQNMVINYGDLIYWWPAIIEKTRLLKAAGITICKIM